MRRAARLLYSGNMPGDADERQGAFPLPGVQVTVAAGDLAAREARGLARGVGENPVAPAHLLGHPRVRERRVLRRIQRDLPRGDHRGLGGDERAGRRLGPRAGAGGDDHEEGAGEVKRARCHERILMRPWTRRDPDGGGPAVSWRRHEKRPVTVPLRRRVACLGVCAGDPGARSLRDALRRHAIRSRPTTAHPPATRFGVRTPEAILDAITTGSMALNADGLSDTQKRMLAEYITDRPLGAAQAGQASAMKNHCAAKPLGNPLTGPSWNGWGADPGNSRFQPAAAARLTAEQVPRLKLKWAFGFPNGASAFGQPTVAGGRIFIGSDNGFVYSIDAASGCVYWSFAAQGGVRTAITIARTGARYAAYFGDVKANVYAIDAETGAQIWMKNAESHPLARVTGAPTLHDGRLYVPVASFEEGSGPNPKYECCTFRGSVVAYDGATARPGLEVLHDSRAPAADEEEFHRHAAVWTGRRRRVVRADDRREARRSVCGHGRCVHLRPPRRRATR